MRACAMRAHVQVLLRAAVTHALKKFGAILFQTRSSGKSLWCIPSFKYWNLHGEASKNWNL